MSKQNIEVVRAFDTALILAALDALRETLLTTDALKTAYSKNCTKATNVRLDMLRAIYGGDLIDDLLNRKG